MDVREITTKQNWEKTISSQDVASFLHSWDWGKFQASVGNKPLRLGIYDNTQLRAQALFFRQTVGKGLISIIYGPRFQVYPQESEKQYEQYFIDYLSNHKVGQFLRIEPVHALTLKETRNTVPVKSRQPQHTLLLDITMGDEALLAQMHKKTRYNVRLAQKKEIRISSEKNTDVFWKLNEATTKRDGFSSHRKSYYEQMLALPICYQLTAYVGDTPVASNIMMVYGNTCTYLHGTSDHAYREYMAPYLLQWEGIQLAKQTGCRHYDFWGTAAWTNKDDDTAATSHGHYWKSDDPLASVTRFKAGFGGEEVSYAQAVEIPIKSISYHIVTILKEFF